MTKKTEMKLDPECTCVSCIFDVKRKCSEGLSTAVRRGVVPGESHCPLRQGQRKVKTGACRKIKLRMKKISYGAPCSRRGVVPEPEESQSRCPLRQEQKLAEIKSGWKFKRGFTEPYIKGIQPVLGIPSLLIAPYEQRSLRALFVCERFMRLSTTS